MGRETVCTVAVNGHIAEAKVLLETESLIVRAPFRRTFPFVTISEITASEGILTLRTASDVVEIHCGKDAASWRSRILNPPSLFDKLGLKTGSAVRLAGPLPTDVVSLLARNHVVVDNNAPVTLLGVDSLSELEVVSGHAGTGVLWIVHRKGALKDTDVLAAGRAAGFVDSKTARVSASHTATKFTPKKK